MKRATISDAPAVLNLQDKAMWVLGFNAAVDALAALPGTSDLGNVIECLRNECEFRDEEGEVTNRLEDLLLEIKPYGPKDPQ